MIAQAQKFNAQIIFEDALKVELKDKIKDAKIIKDTNKNMVNIGDFVTLKDGKRIRYEITSEHEANPLERKISHKSPIGIAIMGKKVGDKVTISTPKGDIEYTIEKIS